MLRFAIAFLAVFGFVSVSPASDSRDMVNKSGEYRLDYNFLMILIFSITAQLMVLSVIIYIFFGKRIRGFLSRQPKQNH